MVALGAILVESLRRLMQPEAVAPGPVMIVAAIGIAINICTALLFMRGSKHDLNVRGAYLHMMADAGVSAGVVVAGLLIAATGWTWIDPVTSLIIVAVIAVGTWGLARDRSSWGFRRCRRGSISTRWRSIWAPCRALSKSTTCMSGR
jgi:cobalt-zinc-cadmium efflux system protein